jgi:hypothetical protein
MRSPEVWNSFLPGIQEIIKGKGSIRVPEGLRPARYVIEGNPLKGLNLKGLRKQMEIGVGVGEKIVSELLPSLFSDSNKDRYLFNFIPPASRDYLKRYLQIHGLSPEMATPLVSRTDMLVDKDGNLKVLEINPDAPEGYALSKADFEIRQLTSENPDGHVYLFQYFLSAYLDFLRKKNIEGRVLVPYWEDGALTPFDANEIERDLRRNGIEALAYPVEEIGDNFPYNVDAIIRIISVTTPKAAKAIGAGLPFFSSDRFLNIPQFPPPWTDLAGLKHLLALLYIEESSKRDGSRMLRVLPPTYSSLFSPEEIKELVLEGGDYVLKEVNSSHGDGFKDERDHIRASSSNFIAQRKVEGWRNPPDSFLYLDQDGKLKKGGDWLVDCDPMGYIHDGKFIYVVRNCPQHPMNVAGENGGALFSSFNI